MREGCARLCQNQDLRDYGIFRICPARASAMGGGLSVFGLAEFLVMRKTQAWRNEILKIQQSYKS